MHTQKGYIIPIVLIILLIMLAGVFVFSQKQAESPIVENQDNSENIEVKTNTQELKDEEVETGGSPEILEESEEDEYSEESNEIPQKVCYSNEDCETGQTCFIRPSGDSGYCY